MVFLCAIEERRLKGPCLFERKQTRPNNKTCLECPHYNLVLRPKVKIEKPRTDNQRRKYLEKWVEQHFDLKGPSDFKGSFYDGELEVIYRMLGQKDPGEDFKNELFDYALKFVRSIHSQVRTVPYMPKKEMEKAARKFRDLKRQFPFFSALEPVQESMGRIAYELKREAVTMPEKKSTLMPLFHFVLGMILFYEKWWRRPVKRDDPRFQELVNYCLWAMRLSKVYSLDSVENVTRQTVRLVRELRKHKIKEVFIPGI